VPVTRLYRAGCEVGISFDAIECNAMTPLDTKATLYTTVVQIAHAMRWE
jgi:hypothetical protein